jgi:hypothetical protein
MSSRRRKRSSVRAGWPVANRMREIDRLQLRASSHIVSSSSIEIDTYWGVSIIP